MTVTGGSNNNSSCLKGANTLPVNIISFDYSIVKDNVELYWQTASEVNNNYFEVQRSYNLQDWEMVSNLDGNGNSNVIINYSIVDANFDRSKDVIYYRLVQVDFDGRINYYRFLVVNYSNKNYEIIVFPNPALYTDAINVYFSGDQNFDAQLLDQYGGLIMKMENNHKQLTIDKGRLARGLYYIKISCYNVEEVRKIIVF
ncbi:MAG: hypothetical protein B6I18_06500 [Bacteroidetes bacterium 4572_112]|nr:MAG: hypothetical protein B6I18_06500 [Bacteroidetes bacterium 4572_112]